MTRHIDRYDLPAAFRDRFRPVKSQPKEKGLAAWLFDAYGLDFYRRLTVAGAIPDAAVWSVARPEGRGGLQLVHGQAADALGYVVAQALPQDGDPASYPLPVALGYRARIAVQALQRLREDLAQAAAAEALAIIDRRIDAYRYPAA